MLRPDKEDPMKVRRCLAFFVSIYAFLVLPNLLWRRLRHRRGHGVHAAHGTAHGAH